MLLLTLKYYRMRTRGDRGSPLSRTLIQLGRGISSRLVPKVGEFPLVKVSASVDPGQATMGATCMRSIVLSKKVPCVVPMASGMRVLHRVMSQLSKVIFANKRSVRPVCCNSLLCRGLRRMDPTQSAFSLVILGVTTSQGVPVLKVYEKLRLVGMTFNKALCRSLPARRPSDIGRHRGRSNAAPARPVSVVGRDGLTRVAKRRILRIGAFRRRTVQRLTPKFGVAT